MLDGVFKFLASPITSLVEGWQTRKNIDSETKALIARTKVENQMLIEKAETEAKVKMAAKSVEVEASYDLEAVRNMKSSWKDEYLLILHTFPIWGYGVPSEELTKRLDLVWNKLETAPYWWWMIYIGIVASTFGLRWLFNNKIERILEK